ncbi:O-antigen ligase family protein [Flavobacterium mesophilum]|uniref:O-antigen ligase family protein n=1 Tax=Flavobacterium mesophilum TaxID=3143495 RepID=UPI0031E0C97A
MKNKVYFFIIVLIVFCTERLQQIFYVGFFDFYPARALFLLLIPFFSYKEFVANSSKEVRNVFKIIVSYIIVVLFSALNSQDVFYSFKKWLDILTIYFFVFLIYGFLSRAVKKNNIEYLQVVFLKNLKVVVLICFVGALFLLRQVDDGGSVRSFGGITIYRRISLFVDANFFCTFLITAFSFIYFSKTKNKIFYILIISLSILLSGSKGGMVSLGIALLFYYRNNFIFLRSKMFPILSVILLGLIVASAVFKPIETIQKITSLSSFSEKSGDETILPRIISWNSGMKQFAQSPLLGIGPGNIVNISKGSKNSNLLSYVESVGFYGLGDEAIDKLATHSNYLEILFEQGIIAFILYLLFVYKILRLSKKAINLNRNVFLSYYIAFCAFFLSTILLSYYPYFMSFLYGMFLFLYDNKIKQMKLVKSNLNKLKLDND